MGKKDKERRVYPKEFKAEAAAPAAADLGISEKLLYRPSRARTAPG